MDLLLDVALQALDVVLRLLRLLGLLGGLAALALWGSVTTSPDFLQELAEDAASGPRNLAQGRLRLLDATLQKT